MKILLIYSHLVQAIIHQPSFKVKYIIEGMFWQRGECVLFFKVGMTDEC
jgi:hypothetical protein